MDTNQKAISHYDIQVGDFVEVEPDEGGKTFVMQVQGISALGKLEGEAMGEGNEPIACYVNAYEVIRNLEQ